MALQNNSLTLRQQFTNTKSISNKEEQCIYFVQIAKFVITEKTK